MKYEELLKNIEEQLIVNRSVSRLYCLPNDVFDGLKRTNNLLGKIKTILKSADKEYERGCDDAWELARKLFGKTANGAYTSSEFYKIFDDYGMASMMENHTYQEALAKVEAYEKKKKEEAEAAKIVVGDVVVCVYKYNDQKRYKGIVRQVDNEHVYIMTKDCVHIRCLLKSEFDITKTGKNIDIQGLLDEIE